MVSDQGRGVGESLTAGERDPSNLPRPLTKRKPPLSELFRIPSLVWTVPRVSHR